MGRAELERFFQFRLFQINRDNGSSTRSLCTHHATQANAAKPEYGYPFSDTNIRSVHDRTNPSHDRTTEDRGLGEWNRLVDHHDTAAVGHDIFSKAGNASLVTHECVAVIANSITARQQFASGT